MVQAKYRLVNSGDVQYNSDVLYMKEYPECEGNKAQITG